MKVAIGIGIGIFALLILWLGIEIWRAPLQCPVCGKFYGRDYDSCPNCGERK